jgi:hypothetical protein
VREHHHIYRPAGLLWCLQATAVLIVVDLPLIFINASITAPTCYHVFIYTSQTDIHCLHIHIQSSCLPRVSTPSRATAPNLHACSFIIMVWQASQSSLLKYVLQHSQAASGQQWLFSRSSAQRMSHTLQTACSVCDACKMIFIRRHGSRSVGTAFEQQPFRNGGTSLSRSASLAAWDNNKATHRSFW